VISEREVLKAFPASGFRKYQKETILRIANAFNSGVKCVLLDAPTGSGKSYINATFCRLIKSFYATPQLTLIDQIKADINISGYFEEIKGRQNYYCYHDEGRNCSVGVCKQLKNFECEKTEVCPYWIRKLKALGANTVLMSFAYFMLEGKTDTVYSFGRRRLLVLDESHSIERYVLGYVSLTISQYSLPYEFYEKIREDIPKTIKSIDELKIFVKAVLELLSVEKRRYEYEQQTLDGLSLGKTISLSKVEDFESRAESFLDSLSETEWVWQVNYATYKGMSSRWIIAQPLYAKLFMNEMVWNRADLFIVSSATLLDSRRFIEETGLDRVMKFSEILHLKVPSTFPVENRPIIDLSVGKMTKDERVDNIGKAIERLEGIIELEKDNNIAVHARSYEFARAIYNGIDEKYKPLIVTHDAENRDEALQKWKKGGGIFICVAFTEGQDWREDLYNCKAQVLFKVPYLDLADRRVARRLELNQWSWYRGAALKETIQAYGRCVRSETDKSKFYVIDSSFWDLMKRSKKELPDWFREALPIGWENKGTKEAKK